MGFQSCSSTKQQRKQTETERRHGFTAGGWQTALLWRTHWSYAPRIEVSGSRAQWRRLLGLTPRKWSTQLVQRTPPLHTDMLTAAQIGGAKIEPSAGWKAASTHVSRGRWALGDRIWLAPAHHAQVASRRAPIPLRAEPWLCFFPTVGTCGHVSCWAPELPGANSGRIQERPVLPAHHTHTLGRGTVICLRGFS